MFRKFLKAPMLLCICIGFVLNIILELCSRDDPLSLFTHILEQPLAFCFNWAVVTLLLGISLFFKRKYFVITLISLVWVGFSIANVVALSHKGTPISPGDIMVIQISWDFIGKYVSAFGLACMVAAVLGFGFLASLLYRAAPMTNARIAEASIVLSLLTVICYILVSDAFGIGIEKERLNYYKFACEEYGYVYSFLRSATERGIDEPDPQELEELEEVVEDIEGPDALDFRENPNILMLQLESFFDVNQLQGVRLSENPVPTYTKLRNFNSHGKLSVPSIGAGTANTEFEILSQMNIDFFGSGEYPYDSVLEDTAIETVAFDLQDIGYDTFAVHSNNATFYDRHVVFSYMGFDTFVSKEYMTDYEETPNGWVKDSVLTGEILDCLDSTEGKDFIYTISVQGHGAYAKEKDPAAPIKVVTKDSDEEYEAKVEYYVNQLKETDDFLLALTTELEKREEPTVLVLFGDHMPPLELDNSQLMFGDIFETEYVIWANYDLPYVEEDLEAYQLASHTMDMAGCVNGFMTELHLDYHDDPEYLDYLEAAQYDMIYGEGITREDYKPSELKLGIDTPQKRIEIHSVSFRDDMLYIRGQNFTLSSEIFINGRKEETEFISPLLLACEFIPEDGDTVVVTQISDDGVELSSADEYIWTE